MKDLQNTPNRPERLIYGHIADLESYPVQSVLSGSDEMDVIQLR